MGVTGYGLQCHREALALLNAKCQMRDAKFQVPGSGFQIPVGDGRYSAFLTTGGFKGLVCPCQRGRKGVEMSGLISLQKKLKLLKFMDL